MASVRETLCCALKQLSVDSEDDDAESMRATMLVYFERCSYCGSSWQGHPAKGGYCKKTVWPGSFFLILTPYEMESGLKQQVESVGFKLQRTIPRTQEEGELFFYLLTYEDFQEKLKG